MKPQQENSSDSNNSSSSIIRLSLRKPREWNWSLTTSSSSPAILLPTIQLWDEDEGNLLIDTRRKVRSKTTELCSERERVPIGNGTSKSSKLPKSKLTNWHKDERLKPMKSIDKEVQSERPGRSINNEYHLTQCSSKTKIPVVRLSSRKSVSANTSDSSTIEAKNQSAIPKPKNGLKMDKKLNLKPRVKESESFKSIDVKNIKIDGNKNNFNRKAIMKGKSKDNNTKKSDSAKNSISTNKRPLSKQVLEKDKPAIPILKMNSSKAIIDQFNNKCKEITGNNTRKDAPVFRKPKMELFICDGPVKNRFNIRRVDEVSETVGKTSSLDQKSTNETNSPVSVLSVLNKVENRVKDSKVNKTVTRSDEDLCYITTNRKKVYRKRSSRRSHRHCSSSSSESELTCLQERPRRKRRSHKLKE